MTFASKRESIILNKIFKVSPLRIFFLISGIEKITFKQDAGPTETMVFKHYNPTQVKNFGSSVKFVTMLVYRKHTFNVSIVFTSS